MTNDVDLCVCMFVGVTGLGCGIASCAVVRLGLMAHGVCVTGAGLGQCN